MGRVRFLEMLRFGPGFLGYSREESKSATGSWRLGQALVLGGLGCLNNPGPQSRGLDHRFGQPGEHAAEIPPQ